MANQTRILSVQPTVFFVREGDALRQLIRVGLDNMGDPTDACLEIRLGGEETAHPLGMISTGAGTYDASVPDIVDPADLWLGLWADGELQDQRTVTWLPQKHWEVYLVQYAHHDLGYTDLPSSVLEEYHGFMDDVLQFCAETEDWPEEDARFRWLCEQAWSAVHYVEARSPEVVDRFVHYCKNGQIEVTALFGNQTLELCGHEELIRLLYPAFELKRRYGIEITSAEHADIPGWPWGLASALAGAGVRYFSPGMPLWYFGSGKDKVHPLWDTGEAIPLGMPAACWWEGPDGARVLLWNDLHGSEWRPYGYDQALEELPGMLQGLDSAGYLYDIVSFTLRGGYRDNAPPIISYAYMVREWNRRWAYPRLVNATNHMFLSAFERRWGGALETLRGDVPGTDYPVCATCTPRETALDRNTHDMLVSAEKLATLASSLADYDYPKATIDKAYRETFYYDLHCWGHSSSGGLPQDAHWSEKGDRSYRAAALSHNVLLKAANKLADEVTYPEDGYYVTVFNPLSHARTDFVHAQARSWEPTSSPMYWREPDGRHRWPIYVSGHAAGRDIVHPPASLLEQPFRIIDLSVGAETPYQLSTVSNPQAARPWSAERVALARVEGQSAFAREVAFVARDLPAMGYRTYRFVPCDEWPAYAVDFTATDTVIENRFFRLELDPVSGAIVSLVDKELARELVDCDAPHPFGTLIVRDAETAAEEWARISHAHLCDAGPVYATIRLNGGASCCPQITEEITLYSALKRVDFAVRVLRDSTPMREVYLAFPFQVDDPQFRFEMANAVAEPIRDQWPGSNTDYYGIQHWADVFNEAGGVAWAAIDTPMAEFGGLWPGYVSGAHHGARGPGYGHPFLRKGELTQGHIYALVSYNNFRTNFINVHPCEYLVRYSFTSHEGDWRAGGARDFGWAVANEPLPVWMAGPQPKGSLPTEASFCQVDAKNVIVLAFKRAEDGDGYILRLGETEGAETQVTATMPFMSLRHVYETNLVEENQRVLTSDRHSVRAGVGPYGITTLRLAADL